MLNPMNQMGMGMNPMMGGGMGANPMAPNTDLKVECKKEAGKMIYPKCVLICN